VWDCGLILAAFLSTPAAKALLDRVGDQVGAIGIDVGCGAGVAGLALASALPDLPVILTDIGVGLTLAARNVAANPSLADRVTVKELWWGTEKEAEVTNGKPVAVVVASDVVYDAEATGPLATTLAALCGPDTVCLLGFRNRTSAQNIRSFFDKLAELGFTQVAVPRADLAPAYRADDAHLLLLTRK
jgi:predicted nicotinamide N-methyase